MKIVEVTWFDTVSASEWMRQDDAKGWLSDLEGTKQKTTGYLFEVTDEYVSTCASRGIRDGGKIGHIYQFPMGCVVDVRDAKTGRKVKLPRGGK